MRPDPAALVPAASLPTPQLPETLGAQLAMFNLRQALLLLAEQDIPTLVTWADLGRAHLSWADMCLLVPAHTIQESVVVADFTTGPPQEDAVPRRVLGLLRKQLDCIIAEFVAANSVTAAKAEQDQLHLVWTTAVMNQARRLQDRKRPADGPAERATAAKPADDSQPAVASTA